MLYSKRQSEKPFRAFAVSTDSLRNPIQLTIKTFHVSLLLHEQVLKWFGPTSIQRKLMAFICYLGMIQSRLNINQMRQVKC